MGEGGKGERGDPGEKIVLDIRTPFCYFISLKP